MTRHVFRAARTSALALAAALVFAGAPVASAAAGTSAHLTVSPTAHDFGTSVVGTASSSQTFAVTNTGQSATGALTTSLGGTDPGDFAIDANTCTGTLAAGAACSVSIHFLPTAAGARHGQLTVTGTPGGKATATLTGTGGVAKLVVSPTSHAYGTVTIGAKSSAQTYTVTNTGAGPSGPVTVALGGANPGDYQQTTTCGAAIVAGGSCTVSVTFAPTATGTRTATLTASPASGTPGGAVVAKLTGTGAARALLTVSPATFDFGPVVSGTPSAAETFTVTNSGLGVSGTVAVALGGADSADFAITSTTCGAKLAINASCTVTVRFTPTAPNAYSASVTATASPGGSVTATLAGTGATPAALAISPATFDFGQVVNGSPSGQQTFTVTDTGQAPSGPVTVGLSGGSAADFAIDGTTCGAALAGGATCTVTVHFTPSTVGSETTTLSATASPGSTASSALTGTGISSAALAISPATFDFGGLTAGGTSKQQTFTVTNTGQAPSGTVTAGLSGTNASDFVLDADTCTGAALAGGATCTVTVHFTAAAAAGTSTASLTATASPGGIATAALQGETVTPAQLTISPTIFDFGVVAIEAPSAVESFTITNIGQSASGIPSAVINGPFGFDFRIASDTCTTSLLPGTSCVVGVVVASFDQGLIYGSITVAASPGAGASATVEAEVVFPAALTMTQPADSGNVLIGSSAAEQSVTVSNQGQQASGVVSVTLSGANASDFTIDSDTCTGPLQQSQTCMVTYHFTPGAVGSRSAVLTASATPGTSPSVTLHGTGVNPVMVSPTSYTFPDQPVDTTSASTTFTLTNYTAAAMTFTGLGSTDATDFGVTGDTCTSGPLAPKGTCTISVDFIAASLGSHTATVTPSFTDGNHVVQSAPFTVTGNAVPGPPDLGTTMAVTSANLGNASVLITVTNHGSDPSVPATMVIDADPTQLFSMEAGAGTDCTASGNANGDDTFTCPVPVIPGGGTYTRTLTIQNLSQSGPRYVQCDATTTMPGDTNSNDDTAYAFVTMG